MHVEPLGDGALRFELPEEADRSAMEYALRRIPGVTDVVFGERTGAVFHGEVAPLEAVRAALSGLPPRPCEGPAGRAATVDHTLDVVYDGPDLARVAAWADMAEGEVIELHVSRVYTVLFLGFLPGFAYLGPVDVRISAPRLPSPRARVEAGALGLAGDRTGVYPFASAGGWNLIGRVLCPMFHAERGALLRAGARVGLRRVG